MYAELICALLSFRGFNDAVNGFNDNGWSLINCEGAEDVVLAVNSTKNLGTTSNPANSLTYPGGVLCAKASMLLQVCLFTGCSVTLNFCYGSYFLLVDCVVVECTGLIMK